MKSHAFSVGVSLLLSTSILLADDAQPTISFELSNSFPLGLETLISARLDDPTNQAATYELTDLRIGSNPVIAQREQGTDRVWLVGRIRDKQLVGKRVTLRAPARSLPARVTVEPRDGGLQFLDQGRDVMFYQQQPASRDGSHTRANYIHPLMGLDGEVLTEAFPDDHKHHHGVFWAWHQLWVGGTKAGDPWVTSDFLTVVREAKVVAQGPVFATLRIVADWTSPLVQDENGQPEPIVEERTRIRLFHTAGDVRWIDFQIQLIPLVKDVRIGGAENERGYSGFTVRVKPPARMTIRSVAGQHAEDLVGGASPWVDVSGAFTSGGPVSGIGILSHRSLPEFPPRWLLRHYGMQNAVYPGRKPISLSTEKPLALRHCLLIYRGEPDLAQVAEHQLAYGSQP